MHNRELTSFLKTYPIFGEISQAEIDVLNCFMSRLVYKKDTIILKQGEVAQGMFLVASGKVRVSVRLPGDYEINISQFTIPHLIGEISLLSSDPASATVTTIAATTTYFLSREVLFMFRQVYPSLAHKITHAVANSACHRIDLIEQRIIAIHNKMPGLESGIVIPCIFSKTPAPEKIAATTKRIDLLIHALGILANFSDEELEIILNFSQLKTVLKKNCIFNQFNNQYATYIILQGAIQNGKIFNNLFHPRGVLGPGQIIDRCLISGIAHKNMAAYVRENSLLLKFTQATLEKLHAEYTHIWSKLYEEACFNMVFNLKTENNILKNLICESQDKYCDQGGQNVRSFTQKLLTEKI